MDIVEVEITNLSMDEVEVESIGVPVCGLVGLESMLLSRLKKLIYF